MHGGQAILKAIERSGVDFILSSPGSEWPPVWEALAEAAAHGAKNPKYINCRHEAVAVAMAAGYTKVTNRPQVVMLHATAGPLNAAMTLRAALQERTPILPGETYGELHDRLARFGAQALMHAIDSGKGGSFPRTPQTGKATVTRPLRTRRTTQVGYRLL